MKSASHIYILVYKVKRIFIRLISVSAWVKTIRTHMQGAVMSGGAKTARERAQPNQLCSLPRHVQQPLESRRLSRLSCPRKSGALTISSAIERRRT